MQEATQAPSVEPEGANASLARDVAGQDLKNAGCEQPVALLIVIWGNASFSDYNTASQHDKWDSSVSEISYS